MNGGPILPNKIDYENMSKEELLQVMKNRNKQYKWQKACVLSPKEGEKLESEILPAFDCKNVSQFVKKIVNGELIVTKSE